MNIKQFISNRLIRGRKPWSVASDFIFFGLILMFLIPSTRSILLSGVATVRTLITGTGESDSQNSILSPENWNWSFSDGQGTTVAFGTLHGEVIFLNQWATWCPPCRAEMPSIERLYRDYGTRVKFVMLTAEDPQVVQEYIEKQGYTFPVYFGSVAGSALATRSIPSTAIIGRTGGMVIRKNGAINWNAGKIRRLLDREISTTN